MSVRPARKELVQQMDKMADAYISLAAAPAPDKDPSMPFPSSLRRSTKLFDKVLQHASPCCVSVEQPALSTA